MDSYKAHGIVLHTIKYGDTSVVAYILTDTYGRRNYLVQGVKSGKGKGNKAALLQPMFLLEFEGIPSHRSQMDRMKDVRLSHPLQHIPFDVRKSTISLFMAEVLYRLIKEVEPNSPLFGFVRASVMALDQMEEGISNFHLWFLVQLSAFLGFYPGNEYTEGDWRPSHTPAPTPPCWPRSCPQKRKSSAPCACHARSGPIFFRTCCTTSATTSMPSTRCSHSASSAKYSKPPPTAGKRINACLPAPHPRHKGCR